MMKTQYINVYEMPIKAAFRGKFIAPNIYVIKEERSQINDLRFQIKKLEKEEEM